MSIEVRINNAAFRATVIRQATPIIEAKLFKTRAKIIDGSKAPKSGREYRLPGGGSYRASAPGEQPARRTGGLLASISEPDVREESGALVGQIKITAPYAIHLERGTPRISPRPFARRAVEEILRGRA